MSGLGHEMSVGGFFTVVSAELGRARWVWPEHADILSRHTEAALLRDIDVALAGLSRVSVAELATLQDMMSAGNARPELPVLQDKYERLHLLADSAQCKCRCGLGSLRPMLRNVVEQNTGYAGQDKYVPALPAKRPANAPTSYCTTYFF